MEEAGGQAGAGTGRGSALGFAVATVTTSENPQETPRRRETMLVGLGKGSWGEVRGLLTSVGTHCPHATQRRRSCRAAGALLWRAFLPLSKQCVRHTIAESACRAAAQHALASPRRRPVELAGPRNPGFFVPGI